MGRFGRRVHRDKGEGGTTDGRPAKYLGVDISKDCSWDAHIYGAIVKGDADIGGVDVILRDSHLDSSIMKYVLINVMVPKVENAEVWEGNAKLVKTMETLQMAAAEKTIECSKSTSKYGIESRVRNAPT